MNLGAGESGAVSSARVKELELELRGRVEMESDNAKLKQENAALIRIISKLSK